MNKSASRIAPATVRYVKLGRGNCWADASLKNGLIYFGYRSVPHELCLSADWARVIDHFKQREGKSEAKAKDCARELRDFYELGSDCLWITFADDHLWWAFAEPGVGWSDGETESAGPRHRKTADGWRNCDINGKALRIQDLSSALTQVAAYRQTICTIRAADYAVRRINGIEEPILVQAVEAREALCRAAQAMIEGLHWADFETMVDLIFARSGWQRISRVGGTQKDVDLVLELPTTGERAAVQVKSRADQATLDDCIQNLSRAGHDKVFFICHSPAGNLRPTLGEARASVHIWQGPSLADAAINAGLFDWLMRRVS